MTAPLAPKCGSGRVCVIGNLEHMDARLNADDDTDPENSNTLMCRIG